MKIFGTHDDATRAQLAKVAERARKVASWPTATWAT